jgi:hypothetical protein
MKTISFVLLMLGLFWLVPGTLRADCVGLGGWTAWVPQNDQKIVFYRGSTPIAAVKLWNCNVYSNSDVRLVKNYVCSNDRMLIDGQECAIFSLDSLSRY